MSGILHLISENSFEAAHALLEGCRTSNKKRKLTNQKKACNTSALFLATKSRPAIEAVRLINALVAAGASLDIKSNEGRYVLLHACGAGVDPMIFDALLNLNAERKTNLDNWWADADEHNWWADSDEHNWWADADEHGNGAFGLACKSGNFNLAEHVLRVALMNVSAKGFLEGHGVNDILKILANALARDESAAIKILNTCHKVTNEVSESRVLPEEKLSFESEYIYSSRVIRMFHSITLASKMFDFILKFHTLFLTRTLDKSILKWYKENDDNDSVPSKFKKFVFSIKRKALWENNKELGLVLLRTYKSRSCTDILEHIVSYVCRTYDDDDDDDEWSSESESESAYDRHGWDDYDSHYGNYDESRDLDTFFGF